MTAWRDGWEPFDPLRPCYTCGDSPMAYSDRRKAQPLYRCLHDPIVLGPGSPPLGTWSTDATQEERDEAMAWALRVLEDDDSFGWATKFVDPKEGRLGAVSRGRLAEIVSARLTGLPLDRHLLRKGYRRSRKRADLGTNVEVRNARYHDDGLSLYDNDPSDRVALLVTGMGPFVLRGWVRVRDGRLRHLYRARDRSPRWLVPQPMLHPMATFRDA